MRRSQVWEDEGNSALDRGISKCKDTEEGRSLESVRAKEACGWSE